MAPLQSSTAHHSFRSGSLPQCSTLYNASYLVVSCLPSHHKPLHVFSSFSMAPTKTMKKNAPSKANATQAKGKGKENAASTAALQAAKKKNQPRKDSGLGMSYHGHIHHNVQTPSFYTQDPVLLWRIRMLLLRLVGLEVARPQLPRQQLKRLRN